MMQDIPQLRRANPPRSRFSRLREREKGAHEAWRIQEAKDERDNLTPAENPSPQQKPLTPREVQVLNLLAASKTHTAIASELGVREHTALAHIRNLRVKLGAKNKLDAVLKGIRSGIVTE
jgi:DNA-binding CsgD family transcriptional regulator